MSQWKATMMPSFVEVHRGAKQDPVPTGSFLAGALPSALEEEREFAVERGHLQERLTVAQIETREVVTDPLGAVPDLPFGHLHSAWKTFVESVGEDDELWSFMVPWQTTWGRKELRTGYVVVRGGIPASHFLTMWKEIEDEPMSDQGAMPKGAGPVYGDERA